MDIEKEKSFSENLNKDVNEILIRLEEYRKNIDALNNKKLVKTLKEYINSGSSTLLVLSDFTFEISSCESEDDLSFLLESNSDFNEDNLPDIEMDLLRRWRS